MAPSLGAMIALILACVLLLFSGYASGSEIAFFSLSPTDLSELEEEKTEFDRLVLKLREESERTLATILITNNLVNVTIIRHFYGVSFRTIPLRLIGNRRILLHCSFR
jgi:CBS domain containing-hemolysin-like protein